MRRIKKEAEKILKYTRADNGERRKKVVETKSSGNKTF